MEANENLLVEVLIYCFTLRHKFTMTKPLWSKNAVNMTLIFDFDIRTIRTVGVYLVSLLSYRNIYLYFIGYIDLHRPHIFNASKIRPAIADICQLGYLLNAEACSVAEVWVLQLKLQCLCCKPGGRMEQYVNFRSQGPEFKSEEGSSRETSRKIAFCSIFIVCLFGLPCYSLRLHFFQP